MQKLDRYMRINDAAEYLGVAANTLRNWGHAGKITERRHPVNGYRLYARDDLDELLAKVNRPQKAKRRRQKPK